MAAMLATGTLCYSMATAPFDAGAASYPDRPIKWIVATSAGSLPDVLARLIAERLSVSLGQPIIVEDRPGAGGTIGLSAVAKAPADGYTLGAISTTFLATPSLIANVPYDTERDLSPIAVIAWNYALLVVRSNLPVHSIAELIAEAKSKPGILKYSSPGNGTPGHLWMKLFEQRTGTEFVHVPYKGAPAATMGLLRGDVDVEVVGMLTLEDHVKSGAVRPLAAIAPRRLASNPELPTISELGYSDLDLADWQGVVAPAGTPSAVIERLSKELADIVAKPDIKERLQRFSMEPADVGPAEFKRLMHSEIQRLKRLVREANIKME